MNEGAPVLKRSFFLLIRVFLCSSKGGKVMKSKKLLPILLGAVLLAGCSSEGTPKPEVAQPEKSLEKTNSRTEQTEVTFTKEQAIEEAKSVIEKNLVAFEEESIEGYLKTLNVDPETQKLSREQVTQQFEQEDLSVAFEGDIKVNSVSDDYKQVLLDVVQITKSKKKDTQFVANKTWATHTVEYKDGKWGITGTEILNAEALE